MRFRVFRRFREKRAPIGLSMAVLAAPLLLLSALEGAAGAAVTTAAGTAAATSGTRFIKVTAPYSEDTDGDNTLLVEWGLSGVDFSLGSQVVPHQTSPYSYNITGLTDGTAYQVRVTYQDPDGVTGTAAQTLTGVIPSSPLMHNSVTTKSSKWGGAWGITGGKYGLFSCATCHSKIKPNQIKQIKPTINTSDGTNWGGPGAPGVGVSFTDPREGTSDFGDDSDNHTASTRVCEACHSATLYHRYDTTGQSAGNKNHYNRADCLQCHRHNAGFKASCDVCHGGSDLYWPQAGGPAYPKRPGEHQVHIARLEARLGYPANTTDMVQQTALCAYCHNDPVGVGGVGHYENPTWTAPANAGGFNRLWDGAADGDGVYTAANGTCSSLDCHNGKATAAGTYGWYDGGASSCVMCHLDVGADTTHTAHTGAQGTFGLAVGCADCHDAAVSWSPQTPPASGHINGTFAVAGSRSFTYTGTYPGTKGSCGTNACHNDGKNGAPRTAAYTWGSAVAGCAACHGDSGATLATQSHPDHLNTAGSPIACGACHAAATAATHLNQSVTLNAMGYTGDLGITGTTFGTCSSASCHQDGTRIYTGTSVFKTSRAWGQAGACNDCHGNATYSDYRKGAPLYASGSPKPNAHERHVDKRGTPSGETQCRHCHSAITSTNVALDGTAPSGHINAGYNVAAGSTFRDGDNVGGAAVAVTVTYTWAGSPGTSTCANVSCHPTGLGGTKAASSTKWSSAYSCTDCHKVDMNNTAGYHHVMDATAMTDRSYPVAAPGSGATDANRKCTMCHVDHDIFSPMLNADAALTAPRAMNLRTAIGTPPTPSAGYANSDYAAAGGGICISCHTNALTKNTTARKSDGTTTTPAVTNAAFTGAAHNYNVGFTMYNGGASFNANCSKCHNGRNGEVASFQSSANKFATHDGGVRRLYAPLGATLTDGNDEQFCYRCHSKAADAVGGTKKSADARDWYGAVTTMTARSTAIYQMFQKTYKHNVAGYTGVHKPSAADENRTYLSANKHVECADCHNVHEATAANPTKGTRGIDPTNSVSNWTAPTAYAEVTVAGGDDQYKICLRCHSSYNTSLATWNAAWTDVGKEFSTANASYHWVEGDRGAAKADLTYGNFNATYVYKMMPRYNGYTNAQLRSVRMRCTDCHGPDNAENNPAGPHGSAYARVLKVPAGSPYTVWSSTSKVGDTNIWCFNCHDPTFTNSGFSGADGSLHTSKHSGDKCMACHIKIPHGWQLPHLLKPYNMATNYPADNAKYNGTGTSSGIATGNWNRSGSWAESSCSPHQNCN